MDKRSLPLDEDFFDPFDSKDEDADEESEFVQIIGNTTEMPDAKNDAPKNARTPSEKIGDLLRAMAPQRKVLLGLIAFCREPRLAHEVDEELEVLSQYIYMVYDGVELRRLLQEAEALVYLEAKESVSVDEGKDVSANKGEGANVGEGEGQTEIGDDGQEYLVIQRKQEGRWLSTVEALELLDAEDPQGDFDRLLAGEPHYLSIYQSILDYCQDARSIKEIDSRFNGEELLKEPRRYSGYFVARLESCGALEWRGGWVSTEMGLTLLTNAQGGFHE